MNKITIRRPQWECDREIATKDAVFEATIGKFCFEVRYLKGHECGWVFDCSTNGRRIYGMGVFRSYATPKEAQDAAWNWFCHYLGVETDALWTVTLPTGQSISYRIDTSRPFRTKDIPASFWILIAQAMGIYSNDIGYGIKQRGPLLFFDNASVKHDTGYIFEFVRNDKGDIVEGPHQECKFTTTFPTTFPNED